MLYPQSNTRRTALKLDGIWKFCPDPDERGMKLGYPQGLPESRPIAVPASWNEQYNDLYNYHQSAWYECSFSIPAALQGKQVVLRFSAVLYAAKVFINGRECGETTQAYLPFEFDITALVRFDQENTLVVWVNGTISEDEPIIPGDFYHYGGINRSVFISCLDETHIRDIAVQTALHGSSGVAKIRIESTGGDKALIYGNGRQYEVGLTLDSTLAELTFNDITPWSCENPQLYDLDVRLLWDDVEVDQYRLRIGFREIEVVGREIRLNGKPIKLRGYNKHEDFHLIGRGMMDALNIRDFDLMKWSGANSFRTSHYPYSEEILDLADEQGFLVIDEAPFANLDSQKFTNPAALQKARAYLETLVKRDYNHPAVISWSIGNESKTDLKESEPFYLELIHYLRSSDNRPITYVGCTKPEEDVVYQHVDIVGVNRYYGWYPFDKWWGISAGEGDIYHAVKELEQTMEQFASRFTAPILVSEFGADCIAGLHSGYRQQFSEEFQAGFIRAYLEIFDSKDYICGTHIWCFADFNTEQSYARVMGNKKGLFTRERQPKLAAFTVRRLWTGRDDDGFFGKNEAFPKA
jgi:beta-glucuronidase